MTDAQYGDTYFGTPVPRTKRRGLARNAAIALGNIGTDRDVAGLAQALRGHDEPLVRSHAGWALGRIGNQQARTAMERALSSEADASVIEEIRLALQMPPRA